MLEKAAGVEGRELSPGERQAQLEKYRFRFVNIYQELEMSSRFVDTHRDVSQGGDGVQLHSHTFYEMIYCCCHARADMEAVWRQSSGVPQLPAHRTVSVMEMVRLM